MTTHLPQFPPGAQPGPADDANYRGSMWQRYLGLQGKLILSFSLLLMVALGVGSFVFVKQSREALSDILGEQARQIGHTLALAAEMPYELKDIGEMHRLGRDLLRSRNIVLVAFCDPAGAPLAVACRDPDYSFAGGFQTNTQHLMQVSRRQLPSLGDFLQITAPVLEVYSKHDAQSSDPKSKSPTETGTRLLGYVTVGISQNNERAMLQRVSLVGVLMSCFIFLVSLPLASGLVHRIFLPIRQLVEASNRIAGGDYEARVATDRPDEIGMLARSFNEMARRIRQHQQELHLANDNLAEANRSLEGKVSRRTAELESANKRLSSEMAEKEDFLRAVSHDLNAPLRNIGGMATMLLMKNREKFDDEIVHRLERIQKNVEVETSLIAELLELSRIKTRRQRIEAVGLDTLVHEIAGMFENDLRQRQIALSMDNTLPTLWCEKSRIRQVFQNLIDNAIKYMGDGPVREIRVGSVTAGDEVEFWVRDTGIGIHKEDLPKVFYVFRRGRNSAEVNVPGKGVGLASVKSIVETHNGRIWVQSEVGKGSAFHFTIPAKRPQAQPDEPGKEAENTSDTTQWVQTA
jgi:signal transduction histidine kinase